MAAQIGEVLTASFSPEASASTAGEVLTRPFIPSAVQSTAAERLVARGGGSGLVLNFSLACFDTVGVRHFWTDTVVSTANAPAGPTYVVSTLVVLGIVE